METGPGPETLFLKILLKYIKISVEVAVISLQATVHRWLVNTVFCFSHETPLNATHWTFWCPRISHVQKLTSAKGQVTLTFLLVQAFVTWCILLLCVCVWMCEYVIKVGFRSEVCRQQKKKHLCSASVWSVNLVDIAHGGVFPPNQCYK